MLHVPRCRPPRCFLFYSSRRHLAIPSWFADRHEAHVKASSSRFVPAPSSKPVPDSTEERQFRQKAASYRRGYMKLDLDTSDFQTLESLQFVWSKDEDRWENGVVPALLQYKELEGDMNVPFSFVVPSDGDWPEEMWGERLGRTVNHIRSAGIFVRGDEERRQWLEDNGFEFDMHRLSWEKARLALLQYKELEGDMDVPFSFVVPSDGDWPEEMWGERLGRTVNSIRSAGQYVRGDEERRQWLKEEGFRFETNHEENARNYGRWEQARLALLQYKELEGDMNVPYGFVVPSNSDWPEEMWGEKLGNTVVNIRSHGQYVRGDEERRQWLEDNGFEFDMHKLSWEKARLALLQYKELKGDMNVPQSFVVPSDGDWPEEMWSERLGRTVNMIRTCGQYVRDDEERKQWLEDNGFVWKVQMSTAERVRAAAEHYGRVRRGAVKWHSSD